MIDQRDELSRGFIVASTVGEPRHRLLLSSIDLLRKASEGIGAGLIICDRCGKRYLGNITHDRSQRYRYFTCFSRHRFGPATCPAERLPADQLKAAVLDALLATYHRTDLLTLAVATLRRRATRRS